MATDLAYEWVLRPSVEVLLRERGIKAPVSYVAARPLNILVLKGTSMIDLEEFRRISR